MKNNDRKHKIWFVLDESLILPEYIINFDYIMTGNW